MNNIPTLLIAVTLAASVCGEDSTEPFLADSREMSRVEAAVDRALEYLVQNQRPDGSWEHRVSPKGPNNGVNGLCILALLGRGHAPDRGPFKEAISRAIAFVLSTQDDRGLYRSPGASHGPMYEHALATLAMIEAYGFMPTQKMQASVQKAVDLIVASQSTLAIHEGGWRYQPQPGEADLSVTVMQVVALRAAINARLSVPEKTMSKAAEYVRRCATPAGGFAYQPGQGPKAAQSAAGALCLQLLGEFDDPSVTRALDWLNQLPYHPAMDGHFHYLNYYAMQAHFQAGDKYWAAWHPRVRQLLLDTQNEDGSWPGYAEEQFNGAIVKAYSTALSAMCLEVYMHYLPAYQR
jgi:prenyltransferase beta subunit